MTEHQQAELNLDAARVAVTCARQAAQAAEEALAQALAQVNTARG